MFNKNEELEKGKIFEYEGKEYKVLETLNTYSNLQLLLKKKKIRTNGMKSILKKVLKKWNLKTRCFLQILSNSVLMK